MRPDINFKLAALAGCISIILASASLTIALLSAASPPLSRYPEIQALEADSGTQRVLAASFCLLGGLYCTAQVVFRRPLSFTAEARRCPTSGGHLLAFFVLISVVSLLLLPSLRSEISSIRAADGILRNSGAVSGLAMTSALLSNVSMALSMLLFLRWWQKTDAARLGDTEAPSRRVGPSLAFTAGSLVRKISHH